MPETDGRLHSADFLRPGLLDDLLDVHSRVVEVGGASVTAAQTARLPRGLRALLGDAGDQTAMD